MRSRPLLPEPCSTMNRRLKSFAGAVTKTGPTRPVATRVASIVVCASMDELSRLTAKAIVASVTGRSLRVDKRVPVAGFGEDGAPGVALERAGARQSTHVDRSGLQRHGRSLGLALVARLDFGR